MALRCGCTVSGIDATRHLPAMVSRFSQYPIRTGSFINEPFERVTAEPVFDCVASFGFIEHFPDFADVIRHQIEFLKPGGTLIIGLPHFRRLQYIARRLLDPKTMDGHHLPSMDFDALRAVVSRNGLDVIALHYWGTCAYWFDGRPYGWARNIANRLASGVLNFIDRHVHFPNRWASPFMLLVARKPMAPATVD
jgi:SAM-dependent methyltransferase